MTVYIDKHILRGDMAGGRLPPLRSANVRIDKYILPKAEGYNL